MDRGVWQATVHGVTESDMTEHTHIIKNISGVCPQFSGRSPKILEIS